MTETRRRKSAKHRVLAALQDQRSLTNEQLNDICYRYGARIFELRQEGHQIDRTFSSRGRVVYEYRGVTLPDAIVQETLW